MTITGSRSRARSTDTSTHSTRRRQRTLDRIDGFAIVSPPVAYTAGARNHRGDQRRGRQSGHARSRRATAASSALRVALTRASAKRPREGAIVRVRGRDFDQTETSRDGDRCFVAAVHVGDDAPDRVRFAQVRAHRGHRFHRVAPPMIGKHDVADGGGTGVHDRGLERADDAAPSRARSRPNFRTERFRISRRGASQRARRVRTASRFAGRKWANTSTPDRP